MNLFQMFRVYLTLGSFIHKLQLQPLIVIDRQHPVSEPASARMWNINESGNETEAGN